MSLIDTTNVIDNSIFLKATLEPNMVGENFYIENLQDKRDAEWEYRYNRVIIEEELPENKQIVYSKKDPIYTSIDAVITNVKNEKGEPLGTDWASLSFRNLKHDAYIGSRYRFALDFPNMEKMSEEEKKFETSIWIAVNKSPIHAGNSVMVRRCNTVFPMIGKASGSKSKWDEIHLEPCILDYENKFQQVYNNMTIPIPQSEVYITMQYNYYTNFVKINDRVLLGTMNPNSKDLNTVYKVKAVTKAETIHTFVKDDIDESLSTPLVILSLDKDLLSPDDDFSNRIASVPPTYISIDESGKSQDGSYIIDFYPVNPNPKKSYFSIRMGKSKEYSLALYSVDGIQQEGNIGWNFIDSLENCDDDKKYKYYNLVSSGSTFTITCKEDYSNGCVVVKAQCALDNEIIEKDYKFTLKGLG